MASGDLPTELKFFLYAKDRASPAVYLLQASIFKDSLAMSLTFKCSDGDPMGIQENANKIEAIFRSALSTYVA